MAIRWNDLPHSQIRIKIHTKLRPHDVARSEADALQHMLRRRLSYLGAEDHRRFIELQARDLVEHLRCTRDCYREFLNIQNFAPALEAHWVVLRFAVFPTSIALLQNQVSEYARLSRVKAVDLSLLFGIHTRTCVKDSGNGMRIVRAPELDDKTTANDEELQSLAKLVNKGTLLWFRDIREDAAIGHPIGGGPFAADDPLAIRRSFGLCGLNLGFTVAPWVSMREKLWQHCVPWTEGLCNLFGVVQQELLSQWEALPVDSFVQYFQSAETSGLKAVVVPPTPTLPRTLERGRDCEQLAQEINKIRHKYNRSGLTVGEIQKEIPYLEIWRRVEQLSPEDKDTFLHPGTWEAGYDNLLLGKLYQTSKGGRAGGTINNWRKEYRAYVRWQEKNTSKSPDNFVAELQQRKRNYRKSRPGY